MQGATSDPAAHNASHLKQEWGEHVATYDLAQSTMLLGELGLDKKGPDGVCLRPASR